MIEINKNKVKKEFINDSYILENIDEIEVSDIDNMNDQEDINKINYYFDKLNNYKKNINQMNEYFENSMILDINKERKKNIKIDINNDFNVNNINNVNNL